MEAEYEDGTIVSAKEDDGAVAAGFALSGAWDALLDDATTEISVDQALSIWEMARVSTESEMPFGCSDGTICSLG